MMPATTGPECPPVVSLSDAYAGVLVATTLAMTGDRATYEPTITGLTGVLNPL